MFLFPVPIPPYSELTIPIAIETKEIFAFKTSFSSPGQVVDHGDEDDGHDVGLGRPRVTGPVEGPAHCEVPLHADGQGEVDRARQADLGAGQRPRDHVVVVGTRLEFCFE